MKLILALAMLAGLMFTGSASAENSKTLQQLKKQTVMINAEIEQLKVELFYPKNQNFGLLS